jgi:hypothetical protein
MRMPYLVRGSRQKLAGRKTTSIPPLGGMRLVAAAPAQNRSSFGLVCRLPSRHGRGLVPHVSSRAIHLMHKKPW